MSGDRETAIPLFLQSEENAMKTHRVLWKHNFKGAHMDWNVQEDFYVEGLS